MLHQWLAQASQLYCELCLKVHGIILPLHNSVDIGGNPGNFPFLENDFWNAFERF